MAHYNQSTRERLTNSVLGFRLDLAVANITTLETLFTIAGGNVAITAIYGEVTTVLETTASACSFRHHPTVGTIADLAAAVEFSDLHVGTIVSIAGPGATNIQIGTTSTNHVRGQDCPVICTPGHVELVMAAPMTGQMKFSIFYLPLEPGAYLSSPLNITQSINDSAQEMIVSMKYGERVFRSTGVATSGTALFTIAGGRVYVSQMYGEVITALEATAGNSTIAFHNTVGVASTVNNLATVVDISSAAIGSLVGTSGTIGDALRYGTGSIAGQQTGWILGPGHIETVCAGAALGGIEWTCFYVPLDADASLVAA